MQSSEQLAVESAAAAKREAEALRATLRSVEADTVVIAGLGRIIALPHRSSTLYQIR
jgi:hypothetical protein